MFDAPAAAEVFVLGIVLGAFLAHCLSFGWITLAKRSRATHDKQFDARVHGIDDLLFAKGGGVVCSSFCPSSSSSSSSSSHCVEMGDVGSAGSCDVAGGGVGGGRAFALRAAAAGPSISLVGSGPGDIGLLTLEALGALRDADVVLADRLIPAAFLRAAVPARAELFVSNKVKGNQAGAQAELDARGLAALRAGRRVVRLKEGDPFVYGRGGEEVLFYRSHGFAPRVLPGISSCLAAPLAAGIPVTHRGVANEVLVATGFLREGHAERHALPPYGARRTTVLLMAVRRLPELGAALCAAGYPADLPAAIVEKATHHASAGAGAGAGGGNGGERVFRGEVRTLAAMAAANAVQSPAVLVLGHVVNVLLEEGRGRRGGGGGVLADEAQAAAAAAAGALGVEGAASLAQDETELHADTRASMLLGAW
jgi:siroheme synthase